jgi:hypothetical protein
MDCCCSCGKQDSSKKIVVVDSKRKNRGLVVPKVVPMSLVVLYG